jgi:hypothetical protein
MDPIKRQMMQEMIEFAARDQNKQWDWIRNQCKRNFTDFQKTYAQQKEQPNEA